MSTKHTIDSWGPYGRRTCTCGERFEEPNAQASLDAHTAAAPDGMGVGEAIRIVAQHALASAARDEQSIDWESYPEISEGDWSRVIDRLDEIAPWPDPSAYEQAYVVLKARTS